MNSPNAIHVNELHGDIHALSGVIPVPGAGILPVNAFLLGGSEPVLVDTGCAAHREAFLAALGSRIDPRDLRWIWLTHADPDHVGNLAPLLEWAPRARVVTTFLGLGKLGLLGIETDRFRLVNPGQWLEAGDRRLRAVAPPVFDAPETTGLFDPRTRTLWSADSFGALLPEPVESAAALAPETLREGMANWALIDAPWLPSMAPDRLTASLAGMRDLAAQQVLSSHLPPAEEMTELLLDNVAEAARRTPMPGPDQEAFEALLAAS
jgi:glyoxylase-like metal-dependent hydrolase (beta-lactamase superfamily II)